MCVCVSRNEIPFFLSPRRLAKVEAWVGSSDKYPSGSWGGSEQGELGLGEEAAREEEWW